VTEVGPHPHLSMVVVGHHCHLCGDGPSLVFMDGGGGHCLWCHQCGGGCLKKEATSQNVTLASCSNSHVMIMPKLVLVSSLHFFITKVCSIHFFSFSKGLVLFWLCLKPVLLPTCHPNPSKPIHPILACF